MKRLFVAAFAMVLLTGCQTLVPAFTQMRPDYSDIPEETLRKVALGIEQAIQEGNQTYAAADEGGVVLNTPEIAQAIRTRAARSELVNTFLDSGHGWEKRNGQLYVIRDSAYKKATTRRERDRNALMVSGEWNDRWTMYEGIRKASNFPPKSLAAIQRIFHEARLECMKPGQKFEDESGNAAIK